MPELLWDASAVPGTVPEAEVSDRVPTPKLEVDVKAGNAAAADYEAFLNDQLNALKYQLLAYHNYQSEPLQGKREITFGTPTKLQTTARATTLQPVSTKQVQDEQVKAWHQNLVLDVIMHPGHDDDDEGGGAHRGRRSSQARGSVASQGSQERSSIVIAQKLSTRVRRAGIDANPIWTRFALTEKNRFRQLWCNCVVGVLIVYVATVFPYKLAFLDFRIDDDSEEPLVWFIIGWVLDICFWIDLAVSFFLSYRNDEDFEVCDIRLIAKRYLTGMFLLDLLACIPSPIFQHVFFPSGDAQGRSSPTRAVNLSKLQRLSRLLRILRLRQLMNLLQLEWVQAIMRFRGFRMGGLFAGVFWFMHLMGCGWYICGALHTNATVESWVARRELPDKTTLLDKGPFTQWVHSCYFVLTVFTTVGFGDMSAYTTGEIIYVCMLMIMGGVINGMVLSHVMNILEESDRRELATQNTINLLKDFADHTQLNSSVTYNLVNLARQSRSSAEIDSDKVKQLFSGLVIPRSAMSGLPEKLWKGKLLKSDFFQKGRALRQVAALPPRMVLFVASMLKSREFHEAGELVYSKGDMPMNLFLILVGTFTFVEVPAGQESSTDLAPYQLFGSRSYFGEYEILTGSESRITTARCEVAGSTALLLGRSDLLALCDDFPAFGTCQRVLAQRREASRMRRFGKLTQHRTYEQLCYQAIIRWIQRFYGRGQRTAHLVNVIPRTS